MDSDIKGCLALPLKDKLICLILLFMLAAIYHKCTGGKFVGDNLFPDGVYYLGSQVEAVYNISTFTSTGAVSDYDFMQIGDKIWDFRYYLSEHGIDQLVIVFILKCVDKYGNKTVREAGRYKLDSEALDYLYRCKDETTFKHFSHIESFLRISFTDNCRGPLYIKPQHKNKNE